MTDSERQDSAHDARMFSASTARNRDPIFDVLKRFLPSSGSVLEIASGSGEHAAYFAPQMPHLTWQPSDLDAAALRSIEAWRQHAGADNIRSAIHLDVTDIAAALPLLPGDVTAITNCNMIHISPWACCLGLMDLAGQILPANGILMLYGPFNRDGRHTAASNADFDHWLQSQHPEWGIRDLETVAGCAADRGLELAETIAMPANNFSLIFRRRAA